uniref:Uncharacterized protein n=1 Tax=Fagus sylvatica TaxID=28930 RepID=A0A2N9ERB2_FAGSY
MACCHQERKDGETSSEATTSARAEPRQPVVPKRWAVYSYFSRFTDVESLDRVRTRYQIPRDVVLRIPNLDKHACSHVEDVALYESALMAGLRFPVQPFIRELLDFLSLAPVRLPLPPGFWTFRSREESSRLVEELPSSNRRWKDGYFFVCGDNWEKLPEEGEDFIPFLRTWGVPSSSGVAIMKFNKSKLKDMVEKGVPAVPVSMKRKRTDDGSSSAPPAPSARPSKTAPLVQASPSLPPFPPIVQIPDEEIPFVPLTDDGSTICRSLGLAAKRAEVTIIELDFKEYANARTEEISKLMVHSLMRSLNEAMVVSRRCLTVEDDLARLKQRLAESEASEKNMKSAVFELIAEKRDLLATVDSVKADLTAREGDAKTAIDARDAAQKELKHLMGQVEGARAAAVSDYKASEAFEENNLQCYLSGIEAFKKQAKGRYSDLDFTDFQPYDDTDSVNEDGRKDDKDQADDATN